MKPSTQVQQLEKELREVEEKIKAERENKVEVADYDFGKVKGSIELKEKEVR